MEINKLCETCIHYKERIHMVNLHKVRMCTVSTSKVLSLKDINYKTEKCGLYKNKKGC